MDNVRVAVIGCGHIADSHISPYLGISGCSITAVCDPCLPAALAHAQAWGLPESAVFKDYRALCGSGVADLVEVLTPHDTHHVVASHALGHGLSVSVQKPMAISLREADDLLRTAAASPGVLKVSDTFIHYPPVARAKQIIDRGDIGEPQTIRLKSNTGDPACGWPVPDTARAWRSDPARSGGGPLTFDDGHHKLAAAWFLMGQIERVFAQIGEGDAPAAIAIQFAGGRMGVWEVVRSPGMRITTTNYAQDDQIEVTGSEGVLWVTRGHGRISSRAPLIVYRGGSTTSCDSVDGRWEASFERSARDTAAAVLEGSEPSLTGRQGRHILEAGLAVRASAESGAPAAVGLIPRPLDGE